jgi:hypothetical protein
MRSASRHGRLDAPVEGDPQKEARLVDLGGFEVKRLVLVFNKEKETKGTYRYQEVEAVDREPAVGSLYLKKTAVGDQPPGQLRVTIEANRGTAI